LSEGVLPYGLYSVNCSVKETQIILHEADEPDLVGDFSNTHVLPGEHGAEADLAMAHADASALRHLNDAFMAGVLRRSG
jgi:hypothetical protein